MSDTQQGPGWWLASDGKWYPPETAATPPPAPTSDDTQPGFAAAPDEQAPPAFGSSPTDSPPAFGSSPTDPPPAFGGAPPDSPAPPFAGAPTSYGAPASYAAPGAAPQNNSGATTSLVLGIISLVACGLITGIPAIITGRKARKEIAASNGQQGGDGMALAGLITGAIGTALSVLGILFFIGLLLLGSTVDDGDIDFDDDLGDINSDPSDGECDEDRFLQDPDC